MAKELNQLFTYDSLVGKTVAQVYIDFYVYIRFTDNSFVVIDEDARISYYIYNAYDYEMEELGIVTAGEREIASQEHEEKLKKEWETKELLKKQKEEEEELKLLAELKLKYERA